MLFKTDPKETKKPLNIAVVGGGISGMGAAFALSSTHNVTLYEARSRLGGHARTLMAGRNEKFPVDTGFMVFNYRNYPNLNALFDQLDIPVMPSNMSFAASFDDGRFEYGLHQPKRLLGDPKNAVNPKFWRMIADILKFNKNGGRFKHDETITIGDVVERLDLSDVFRDRYLGPLAGAIWSTNTNDMLDFPAQSLLRFFENHGLMSRTDSPEWYTVDGGSRTYVDRLEAELLKNNCTIRLKTPIKSLVRTSDHVEIGADGNGIEVFDQVVFACHTDQALRIMDSPTKAEQRILGAIRYKNNTVILHDDPSQMPVRKACWSSWVYKGFVQDPSRSSFTYWMNLLQSIPNESPVFVTLNPNDEIPQEHIFNQTSLAHPQFDLPALQAQRTLPGIQGQNRTWYCGAYAKYGFHEDGLSSGLETAQALHISHVAPT